MKRYFMILAVMAAVVMLAGTAFAGIVGTSHEDTTLTQGGACSACHLPHGAVAGGNRLWPSNPTTVLWPSCAPTATPPSAAQRVPIPMRSPQLMFMVITAMACS